jgi:predicted Zn-dependent protease
MQERTDAISNVLAKDGKKVQRALDQLYAAFDGNVDALRALVELYCAQQKQHDAAGTKRERKQKGTLTWTPGYFQPKYGKHFFYKADTERGNYRVVPAIKPGTRALSHYTVSFSLTGSKTRKQLESGRDAEEAQAIAEQHHQGGR